MPVIAPYFFSSSVSDFLEKSDDAILGAGKTLVGLNVATQESTSGLPAVYLSTNGPLVAVLTEAP